MKIRYECPRCEKETLCNVIKKRQHTKLVCSECKKYIKFISASELLDYPELEESPKVDLEEINFKLGLILNHLGIVHHEDSDHGR